MKSGLVAAGVSAVVSTVENVSAFVDGKITASDMVTDIVKDTGAAGVMGYGTAFVSTAISHAMAKSSSTLIQSVGGSCLPAAAVAFAIDSYDAISSFAQGDISGGELAYDLGESAAAIAGSMGGGALVGGALGSVAGPVGTVAGGIVGGVVGAVVATEIYATAVEVGAECVEMIAEHAENLMKGTVELIQEVIPEKVGEVTEAIGNYIQEFELPFRL